MPWILNVPLRAPLRNMEPKLALIRDCRTFRGWGLERGLRSSGSVPLKETLGPQPLPFPLLLAWVELLSHTFSSMVSCCATGTKVIKTVSHQETFSTFKLIVSVISYSGRKLDTLKTRLQTSTPSEYNVSLNAKCKSEAPVCSHRDLPIWYWRDKHPVPLVLNG